MNYRGVVVLSVVSSVTVVVLIILLVYFLGGDSKKTVVNPKETASDIKSQDMTGDISGNSLGRKLPKPTSSTSVAEVKESKENEILDANPANVVGSSVTGDSLPFKIESVDYLSRANQEKWKSEFKETELNMLLHSYNIAPTPELKEKIKKAHQQIYDPNNILALLTTRRSLEDNLKKAEESF